MKKKIKRILIPTIFSILLIYKPVNVYACGPFFTEVRFAFSSKPGEPTKRFVQGQVGLVFPNFDNRYLELSFEYLAGKKYTPIQQDSIFTAWNPPEENYFDRHKTDAIEQWKAARAKVPNHQWVEIQQYFSGQLRPGEYIEYLNINDDAFAHAAEVLEARIREFGIDHPAIADWVHAQDQVFALGKGDSCIPVECDSHYPLVFHYDRFYQIASANFYARNFDLAKNQFMDLSRNQQNPWAKLCRYMAARTLIRKATLAYSQSGVVDTAMMEQAKIHLQKMLSDTSMESFRMPVKRLLNFVLFRIDSDELLKEIGDTLLACSDRELARLVNEMSPDYYDYCMLSGKRDYRNSPKYLHIERRVVEAQRNVARSEEKTDWIWCFRSDDSLDYEHAMKRWNNRITSQAWFVCVFAKTRASDPRINQLLEHARSIPSSSPSYPMVQYHRIRLLQDLGRVQEARSISDVALKAIGMKLPNSSTNYFLVQRANLSNSLTELLTYGQLHPVGYDYPESKPRSMDVVGYRFLMYELAEVNNHVPIQLLANAAAQGVFKENLAAEIALPLWVKAILLNQDSIAMQLASILQTILPELKEEFRTYIETLDFHARHFHAIYMMMKNPGMSPYLQVGYGRSDRVGELNNIRDNWWSEYHPRNYEDTPSLDGLRVTRSVTEFLSENQRQQAEKEWKLLGDLPPVFSIFTAEAVQWANAHPTDPRSPEALYLAIRASRYSAAAVSDSLNARAAFVLLHKKYPKSSWAKKSPYWFK
ncbi:MAG: hypothetical protein WBW16_07285 [Bacteroidota bacterium]